MVSSTKSTMIEVNKHVNHLLCDKSKNTKSEKKKKKIQKQQVHTKHPPSRHMRKVPVRFVSTTAFHPLSEMLLAGL